MWAEQKIGTKGADGWTLCMYLALVALGVLMVYTVSQPVEGYPDDWATFFFATNVGKQIIWVAISLFVFVSVFFLFDEWLWRNSSYTIYGLTIIGLILVLLIGAEIKGAKSWFRFAGFTIQPSELAKFGTCLAMATYLNSWSNRLGDLKTVGVGIAIWLVPSFLILLQPDAGSALVFFAFLIPMYREGLSPLFFWLGACISGAFILGIMFEPLIVSWYFGLCLLLGLLFTIKQPWRVKLPLALILISGLLWGSSRGYQGTSSLVLLGILLSISGLYLLRSRLEPLRIGWGSLLLGLAVVFGANYFFNEVLQPHQQARIMVWLQPTEADAQGAGYNVAQSKLAMASGGVFGKGIGEGTMTRYGHVPEQETDFIFSAIGEEQGFIGVVLVLLLYLALLFRITKLAERQRHAFHRAYAYGVAGIIFLHLLVNIGMVMGLMPVIGIPLPFISKGGSSLLGFSIMLAVLLKLDKFRAEV